MSPKNILLNNSKKICLGKQKKIILRGSTIKKLDSPCFPKFIGKFNLPNAKGYILEYMEGQVFEDLLMEDGHQFTKKKSMKLPLKC